ncbi:hypothetical protein TNCV_932991 [Trichonephila clavipes]|nr:hypothetical protein TNCV_932991 [Trichonephila clavipes]
MANVLEVTILSGKLQGEVVLLPQIPMIVSDSPTHSNVCSLKFALAFAMAINISKGQTMTICCLDLEKVLAFCKANYMLHVRVITVHVSQSVHLIQRNILTRSSAG